MGAHKRPNRTFEEIARSGVFDDSPEEVDHVEILGKAQFVHERPTNVYFAILWATAEWLRPSREMQNG
jgi:hypothetical protein